MSSPVAGVMRHVCCIVYILLMTGCTTFQIVDLNESVANQVGGLKANSDRVGVQPLEVSNDYGDAVTFQQDLANALRREGVFNNISHPVNANDNVELLIRGKVSGKFRKNGAKNFFTWWPGPLIFAHNWRGTRFVYDAFADIELINAGTGEVLGNYHAESAHELIHKSAGPGPFIGALVIIPGVIKGAVSVSPRGKYRKKLYEATYTGLWHKVAVMIAQDQEVRDANNIAEMQDKCGKEFDAQPQIGGVWANFLACQSRQFRMLGQQPTETGIATVYVSDDQQLQVHVTADGKIVGWYVFEKKY